MLADDLVQDTLNKALLNHSQLKDSSSLKPWLFKILHNCWIQYLRSKKPSFDIDNIELLSNQSPEKQLSELHIVDRVRKAVEMLPLNQRQVITLVDLEENSYQQVSEILDIPLGTVMSRLSRARTLLKSRLIGISIEPTQNRTKHLKRLV
jgi:RNA polymerase sigma-70 factor (ECF subfamily)